MKWVFRPQQIRMELMENIFSLVVCIISFLQVFHTIIFLEFDTSIPYSFIVFMFLFLSSLGLIFGSRIMLSEGEFLEHSSTTGKGRVQRRFADHNFQPHSCWMCLSIFLISSALPFASSLLVVSRPFLESSFSSLSEAGFSAADKLWWRLNCLFFR